MFKHAFAVAAALTITAQSASASSFHDPKTANSASIHDGRMTLAPLSFVRFCMNNRSECDKTGDETSVVLDAEKRRALADINHTVNRRIAPDFNNAGRKAWSLTTRLGDCNDYAIQKRHMLIGQGWPSGALSLAVVMTDANTGHLVLSIRTDRGDMVLDNLREEIVAWNDTNYRWVKRQSAETPKYWVDLQNGPIDVRQTENTQSANKLASTDVISNPDTATVE